MSTPVGLDKEGLAQGLPAAARPLLVFTVGHVERRLEVFDTMVEVEHRCRLGKRRLEEAPVVLGPVGDGDECEIGTPLSQGGDLIDHQLLEAQLVALRHATVADGAQEVAGSVAK